HVPREGDLLGAAPRFGRDPVEIALLVEDQPLPVGGPVRRLEEGVRGLPDDDRLAAVDVADAELAALTRLEPPEARGSRPFHRSPKRRGPRRTGAGGMLPLGDRTLGASRGAMPDGSRAAIGRTGRGALRQARVAA